MNGNGDYVRNVTSPRELVLSFYGLVVQNPPVESDYTVTTAAVALGSNRGQRTGYLVSNTGTNNVAIGWSRGVTLTTGILLETGGTLNVDWYLDQDLVMYPIWAISNAGGTTLHMVEKILTGE